MKIKVYDQSTSYTGILFDNTIIFKCDHDRAFVTRDEYPFAYAGVICPDCNNEDLTDKEVEELIDYEFETTDTY